MYVDDLDTPVITVDLNILEKNIRYMAEHCRRLDIRLRAHTKTHKIPEIAHMQVASGAVGIACQKLGEAEVMGAAGIKDILITYDVVGRQKVERLTRLAKRVNLTVTVDSLDVASGISKQAYEDGCEVGVLVELDTGGGRTGVQSPKEALELAEKVISMPGLAFRGIMTYPSHERAKPIMEETLKLMRSKGIPVEVVSGGGTGLEAISKDIGCTETRSGSYAFEGPKRVRYPENPPNPETCALRVITTVVSTPTPNRVVVDAGQKSLTLFTNFFNPQPPPPHYGYIVEYPEAKMRGMFVEHGIVDVSACKHKFKVGERLSVIPVHQEMTLNLHDELVGVRGGKVEVIWPVAARGKTR